MRKLAIFSFAFAAAAAAYVWLLPRPLALLLSAALALSVLLLRLSGKDRLRAVRIGALGVALALLWCRGYEALRIAPLRSYVGLQRAVTLTVSDYPEARDDGFRVEARLGHGRVMLYLRGEDCALRPGDRVSLAAEVKDVSGADGTDNLSFQAREISLLVFPKGELSVQKAERLPVWAYPKAAAHALREVISDIFPQDTAGFARALVTGDKSQMDFAERNRLAITGISHTVAVSGLHVSLLVGVLMALCLRRRRLAAAVAIPCMLLFAAMLGFSPSVTRAVVMETMLLLAPLLNRENDPPTALGFALLVLLLANPWAIASLSLQLSFLSIAGISCFNLPLGRRIGALLQPATRVGGALWRFVAASCSTTLSAIVFTTPVVALRLGTLSLVAPLTNLLTLQIVSVGFCGAILSALLGLICRPLGTALAWLDAWPLRWVQRVAELLSRLPYAAVYTNSRYICLWLAAAYLGFGVYLFLRWRNKPRSLRALAALTALTLLIAVAFGALPETQSAGATVFDVGQGQCILLSAGERRYLVDCGGDDGAQNGEDVARSLLTQGIRTLDALILTHYDSDHTCGTAQLLQRVTVTCIYAPAEADDANNQAELLSLAQEYGIVFHFVTEDERLALTGGALQLYAPTGSGADNDGLAVLLSVDTYDILITGDMDLKAEHRLLETHALPDIEVLVAGHHGSKYATGEELLTALRPETVLISVGENSYGHPTQETLDRIAAIGAAVYRTDQVGNISVSR